MFSTSAMSAAWPFSSLEMSIHDFPMSRATRA